MSDLAENDPGSAAQRDVAPTRPLVPPSRLFHSMAFKLTLLVALALTLMLAGLLAGSSFYWRTVLRAQVDRQLSAVAASRRDMVQARLAMLLQRITLNTDRGEVRGFLYELAEGRSETNNRESTQASLNLIANGHPVISTAVVDKDGKIVLSSSPQEVGREITKTSEFQAGLHEAHVGWPRAVGNRFEATLTAPIRTRADPKRVYGVMIATVDVSDLAAALSDTTGLGQTGEALLAVRIDNNLRFLFPPRNAPETTTVPLEAAPALAAASSGRTEFFKTRDYRNIPVLAAGQPINYRGWALAVKIDQAEAYSPVDRALQIGALAGLALIAGSLVVAYLLARSFMKPVRQLAEAAARVAGGDDASQVPVSSADELGALSASFNTMVAAIHARRTERDAAEETLRETDRRKDEFLAVLGHELRNPLSAISHAVRVIEASADDPHADEAARQVITRQTGNLTRLVEDLLDVARISKGKIELRKQPVEIGQALIRAVETIRRLADERRHSVDLVLTSGGQLWIEADSTRLDQIITNLLINAVKYTPDGGRITVTERLDGRDAVITVRDNGIGIAPDMLTQIFELFTQVDRSLAHPAGGLGIGLHLCHQLVDLHGGTITAQSGGIGKGATFTLRFPIVRTPVPATPSILAKPRAAGAGRRVLLVDDNVDTVHSMTRLLKMRGHDVATATDGLEALKVAREFLPDFILLDIGLPSMDGYSLARRLRAEGFTDTPIVAVSGYAQQSDRNRSREAGFNHHFAKPIDFEALAELILEEPLSHD
jgi:signal transduction histidine kinase/ActR/RegA family two-component response regulator